MNTLFPTLMRRELWEHRALWIAPLVVTGLILVGACISVFVGDIDFGFTGVPMRDEQVHQLFASAVWALTVPHYLTMMVVLFFYLLDSLYTERRDRSILFWKSMPVSDTATVISKLLVAAVLVPLGVFALALMTDLLVSGIWAVRLWSDGVAPWDTLTWLRVQGFTLLGLLVAMLWYAPVMGYLMLVSAWAKRNVFLWAVLPLLLIVSIEAIAADTDFALTFLGYRLADVWGRMMGGESSGDGAGFEIKDPFGGFSVTPALTNIDLWIGLVIAAALVYGAIRVRRYRDDT